MRNRLWSVVLVGALGCGGGSSQPDARTIDAETIDAELIDAQPIDAVPIDGELTPAQFGTYVIDRMLVPTTAEEASAYGFDLDGDSTIDNQLGNILSAIVTAGGADFEVQADLTAALDRGDFIVLGAGVDCIDGPCFGTFAGTNPQPAPCTDPQVPATCRQHLDGTATFDVDTNQATDTEVHGSFGGSTFTGTSGTLLLPVAFLGGAPTWVTLIEARARLHGVGPSGFATSHLGGAIPDDDVQGTVIPATYETINDQIVADCGTTCACTPNSSGETFLGIFDDDTDCVVTLAEFQNNSLILTLFRPDLDTDDDGTNDALSLGVEVTAVPAGFALP